MINSSEVLMTFYEWFKISMSKFLVVKRRLRVGSGTLTGRGWAGGDGEGEGRERSRVSSRRGVRNMLSGCIIALIIIFFVGR